jgi:hypothetical protein
MKYAILALGMLGSVCAHAQREEHQHNFDQSVFSIYRELKPVNADAMAATQKKVRDNFPGWSATVDKLNSSVKDMYGPALKVTGTTAVDKAANCMASKLKILGIDAADWKQVSNVNGPQAEYVDYEQYVNGHKVAFSSLSFRFTKDGRLTRIKMKNYGYPENGIAPSIDGQAILNVPALIADLSKAVINNKEVGADWEWFPIPTANGYTMHPAWSFTVTGTNADNMPLELHGYIDAISGELLSRTSSVRETFNITVKSDSVYSNGPTLPPTTQPLIDLIVTTSSKTDTTDTSGLATFTTLNAPQSPTIKLQGLWSTVHTGSSSGTIPSFNLSNVTNNTTYLFPTVSPSSIRHINAYYNVNVVHDFMKIYFPSSTGFTKMDFSMPTNVDVTGGSCNAFYSNKVINFYAAGNGCNSFTTIYDVIYHEYGHGISDQFYNWKKGSGTINNGALNEACSDVWAMCITKNPYIGHSYVIGDTNSMIRRYDVNPKVFPEDIVGEVHADGEIVAGCWWDVAVNIGSVDTMAKLFTATYYDVPDGPTGTEGDIYHDVLISTIMADDDDANLSNGTPHLAAIVSAFAKHGIYLMSDAVINHTELGVQAANTAIDVTAKLTLAEPAFFQDLKLFYRDQIVNHWDSVTLTNTGNYTFTGQIPAQNALGVLDYYFAVYDVLNNSTFGFPNGYNRTATSNQVTIPYQFSVGMTTKLKVDFESPADKWTIGNVMGDNAKGGIWIQAKPVASSYNSLPVQTGADHTTGSGQCLVTGNASSTSSSYTSADVDSGKTTVLSPVYDMADYTYPVIEYYRWYSDDRGSNARNDLWQVQMKDSAGIVWYPIESTYQSDYNWRKRTFPVRKYLPNARYIQLRFIATDAINTSLQNSGQNAVEAAIDDFAILDLADLKVPALAADNISVYPNPANTELHVKLPAGTNATISLTDITGRRIFSENVSPAGEYIINTAPLTNGQYFLTLQTSKSVEVKKVVILH